MEMLCNLYEAYDAGLSALESRLSLLMRERRLKPTVLSSHIPYTYAPLKAFVHVILSNVLNIGRKHRM